MAEIIGVRFKKGGKIYYFRPNDEQLETGCYVIVETVRGTECGEVVMDRREIDDKELGREIKGIIRKANKADMERMEENKKKAARAFEICNEKIKAHGLAMNLLEVEYTFDNSKIIFNFSAEGRVDFRELVKDLASVFRARIELRQIGVRDEAKMLGGLGVCGRPFCCKQFMGDFQSVSIKMAKEQGLSLNPVKISGTCGRLMCCLNHEQDTYEALMRVMPPVGSPVTTPEGDGVVVDRELVAGKVKVRLNGSSSEVPPKTFKMSELLNWSSKGGASAAEVSDLFGLSDEEAAGSEEWEMPDTVEQQESGEPSVREPRRPKGGKGNSRRDGGKEHAGGNSRRGGRQNDRAQNEPPQHSERAQGERRRPERNPAERKGGSSRPAGRGERPDSRNGNENGEAPRSRGGNPRKPGRNRPPRPHNNRKNSGAGSAPSAQGENNE